MWTPLYGRTFSLRPLSSCNGLVTPLGKLLSGERAKGMGVPHRPPANRHDRIPYHRQHLVGWHGGRGAQAFPGSWLNLPDAVDVPPPAPVGEKGGLVGLTGTHQPLDLLEGLVPIEPGLAYGWLVGSALELGTDGIDPAGLQLRQGRVQGAKPLLDQPLAQRPRRVVVVDLDPPLREDRPGVDPWHRQVHGDPRLEVAIGDRPVDRLRSAVARELR